MEENHYSTVTGNLPDLPNYPDASQAGSPISFETNLRASLREMRRQWDDVGINSPKVEMMTTG